MALTFLFDIGLVIIVSAVLAYAVKFLRQPAMIAFVLAGILVGPAVLGIISSTEEITQLSELGIIFLLFSVGLELDFRRLRSVGFATLLGGAAQIALTFAIGFGAAALLGLTFLFAVCIGLMMAFSSTMIVAKILSEKDELNTMHGRIMIGILLLQDVVAVVVLPFLSAASPLLSPDFVLLVVLKGTGLFAAAIAANKFVFPRILEHAASRHELLFVTAMANCFFFIGISYFLGFSMAIGGFIAGLSMANFPYNVEIEGEVHALRDFFSILFFSSLGMQLNFLSLAGSLPLFIGLLLMLLFIKPAILAATYLLMGYGGRTAAYVGLGLGQTSEFMFIIAAELFMLGSVSREFYSLLVGVVVISIILTPYMIRSRHGFHAVFSRFGGGRVGRLIRPKSIRSLENVPEKLAGHVVLFGAHRMGGKVVDYLAARKEKFVVVERDPEIVKRLAGMGIYTVYGDAENDEVISRVAVDKAKLLVMTIPYADVTSYAIRKAKKHNPGLKVFARAHGPFDAEKIRRAGADMVIIPEVLSGEKVVQDIGRFLGRGKG